MRKLARLLHDALGPAALKVPHHELPDWLVDKLARSIRAGQGCAPQFDCELVEVDLDMDFIPAPRAVAKSLIA